MRREVDRVYCIKRGEGLGNTEGPKWKKKKGAKGKGCKNIHTKLVLRAALKKREKLAPRNEK